MNGRDVTDLFRDYVAGLTEREQRVVAAATALRWFDESLANAVFARADESFAWLIATPLVIANQHSSPARYSIRPTLRGRLRSGLPEHAAADYENALQRATEYFHTPLSEVSEKTASRIAEEIYYLGLVAAEFPAGQLAAFSDIAISRGWYEHAHRAAAHAREAIRQRGLAPDADGGFIDLIQAIASIVSDVGSSSWDLARLRQILTRVRSPRTDAENSLKRLADDLAAPVSAGWASASRGNSPDLGPRPGRSHYIERFMGTRRSGYVRGASNIFDRAETISVDERTAIQNSRLQSLVNRLIAAGGVQAERLRAAGIDLGDELSVADLPGLPSTNKADLWRHYPYGMFAVPMDEVVCMHGSSSTGGRSTIGAYTQADIELWARVMARCLAGAGATRRTIIHNAHGYGMFTGGMGFHHGAVALGATVIPVSSGAPRRQVDLIRDLQPDMLACTPSYAIYLGEAFADLGVEPDEISLKIGLHGAESWSKSMHVEIERLLGIESLDIYGLSEIIGPGVACETLDSDGWLHVQEDHFYVEVLDSTGAPVPDGELGELTFTTLTKQALPLLRYRTGDLACLDRTPSRDGRTTVKMSNVTGRIDDMLAIQGVHVYPSQVEQVVVNDPAAAPQYLLIVDERNNQPRLIVYVEAAALSVDWPALRSRLSKDLMTSLELSCDVRIAKPGALPRTTDGKAKRVYRGPDAAPYLDRVDEFGDAPL